MKIKDGYLLRTIAGNNVVIAVSDKVAELDGIVTLNELGAFLWNHMEKETDEQALLQAVLDEYDVDEATAKSDIAKFIKTADEHGFLYK